MNPYLLMLEADPDDRYITREVLAQLGIKIPIEYYSGSTDFFKALSTENKPALILLAYNSHPENGLEVLKKLKADANYTEIPVVILSDSDHPKYRQECYRFGASSFIKKPATVADTNKKIAAFFKYWLEVAEL